MSVQPLCNYNFILQNIRSMRKNFDRFLANINALNNDLDIIFLTETWISSSEISLYHIDGYSLIANCNDQYRSGGVALFIKSSLVYDASIMQFSTGDLINLTVHLGNIKCCFILVYRFHFLPVSAFLSELNDFLVADLSKHRILLGDININLLSDTRDKDDYLLLCSSFGLESYLNDVSRPCSNSCLDHFFAEDLKPNFAIKIMNHVLNVTDHNTIHIKFESQYPQRRNRYKPLATTKINYTELCSFLSLADWGPVLALDDPNAAYSTFITIFTDCLNKSKSTCTVNSKHWRLKPWMTNNLLKLINFRNSLIKKSKRNVNNQALKYKISKLNSKINALIPRIKEKFFKNKFSVAADIKTKWKVVNSFLGYASKNDIITSVDVGDNQVETDPSKISDMFNKYFTQIPYDTLQANKENALIDNASRNNFLHTRYINSSMFLFPICDNEIVSIVYDLKATNSVGIDEISSITLRKTIFSFVHVLTFIFNLCLSKGIFPDRLKMGVVKPLFKKGSRQDMNNYRPITLLNTLSKVLEKAIKTRLLAYLQKINFLDPRQYGFIKNSSTEKALLSFLTPLHKELNDNCKAASLFVDISKAFDTVNHQLLLSKLFHIGVRGVVLKLFETYLTNRRQSVCINSTFSDVRSVSVGVPQGSVLGPLLFLIYSNSIFSINLRGKIVAFADDIALLYSSRSSADLKCALNEDIVLLKKWFFVHDLILSTKSKVMYFSVSRVVYDNTPFVFHSLLCNGSRCNRFCVPMEIVDSFKYLGLLLDSQLNFKKHVNYLKGKLRHALRTFYYLRKFCSPKFLKILYYALVDSHLQYGLTCWGGIYLSNLKSLISIQKGILRVINRMPRTTPSFPLFASGNILPLRYLYVFKVLKAYYIISGNRITSNGPYQFRNINRVKIPFPNREHFRKFFSFTAPKLYNNLPNHIFNATNFKIFTALLKKWLFTFNNIEILFETVT